MDADPNARAFGASTPQGRRRRRRDCHPWPAPELRPFGRKPSRFWIVRRARLYCSAGPVEGRDKYDAQAGGHSGVGHRRILEARRRRRGSDSGAAPRAQKRPHRPDDIRASGPCGQAHRRRSPGRIPQRGRRSALRHRDAERHDRAQRRPAARAPHRIPRRHSPRRRGRGKRRRPDGRRRQYRGAPGRHRQTGRDLPVRGRLPPGQGAARADGERSRSQGPQEHRRPDPGVFARGRLRSAGDARAERPSAAAGASGRPRVCRSSFCPSPASAATPNRSISSTASPRA